jgi:hypothetical protein
MLQLWFWSRFLFDSINLLTELFFFGGNVTIWSYVIFRASISALFCADVMAGDESRRGRQTYQFFPKICQEKWS